MFPWFSHGKTQQNGGSIQFGFSMFTRPGKNWTSQGMQIENKIIIPGMVIRLPSGKLTKPWKDPPFCSENHGKTMGKW
jgi:hypothetical protein